jgi:hypothetical protein
MNRLLVVASVLVVGVWPGVSAALEISNVVPRYGPLGAVRAKLECLPKDVIIITYDLADLTVDAKSGKAKYTILMELLNAEGKVLSTDKNTYEPMLQLGGGKMPGDLVVQVGAKQAPGKYTIRLTVTDELDKVKANAGKQFSYPYEVVPDKFGLAAVRAPAFGWPGGPNVIEFAVVNFALDKKNQAKGEVSIRIFDAKGKQVDAVQFFLPADVPEGANLKQVNVVPIRYPIFMNRPGRFTVEIAAEDKLGNAKAEMRYSFNVIDINAMPN